MSYYICVHFTTISKCLISVDWSDEQAVQIALCVFALFVPLFVFALFVPLARQAAIGLFGCSICAACPSDQSKHKRANRALRVCIWVLKRGP